VPARPASLARRRGGPYLMDRTSVKVRQTVRVAPGGRQGRSSLDSAGGSPRVPTVRSFPMVLFSGRAFGSHHSGQSIPRSSVPQPPPRDFEVCGVLHLSCLIWSYSLKLGSFWKISEQRSAGMAARDHRPSLDALDTSYYFDFASQPTTNLRIILARLFNVTWVKQNLGGVGQTKTS
jgi:hypothetical protein